MRDLRSIVRVGVVTALWIISVTVASAAMLDPCTLLTAAQAQTVLGVPVTAPQPTGSVCVFSPASGSGPTLSVFASRLATKEAVQARFKKTRRATEENVHDVVDVPGLGDAAYTGGAGHFVVFIKGTAHVTLMIIPGTEKGYGERLIQAAKIAAGRL